MVLSDLGKSVVYERTKISLKYYYGVGVTDNNRLWIRRLDLLALLLQLQPIVTAHNQ
jgi:hypothetical protein